MSTTPVIPPDPTILETLAALKRKIESHLAQTENTITADVEKAIKDLAAVWGT